jgi:formiminotetrahydrofolate cyclodeaminase
MECLPAAINSSPGAHRSRPKMHDASTTISAFLDAAAAKQPTPGGGSIAALAGALAASMGEMVLNFSVNKKDLQIHRPELEFTLGEMHRARKLLLALMAEDQAAYAALTDAKKSGVAVEMETALTASIQVPQAIGATAIAMLEIAGKLVDKVNRHLLSDLAVCGDLAMATARCASYNIRANLPEVADADERQRLEHSASHLVARGIALIRDLSPRIWARVDDKPASAT